jgi:hypothetical protein
LDHRAAVDAAIVLITRATFAREAERGGRVGVALSASRLFVHRPGRGGQGTLGLVKRL